MSIRKSIAWSIPLLLGFVSIFAVAMLLWKMNMLGANWHEIIEVSKQKRIMGSVLYSLVVSVIATALSISIGVMIVRQSLLNPSVTKAITRLNISFYYPHFIVALYVYLLFSFIYPYIGEYHKIYGTFEIVLTYLLKEIPFVVFYLMTTYRKMETAEMDVVRLSGGGTWQLFTTVEFPKIAPQLAELWIILVSFIWTAYEIPSLVGNSFPAFLGVVFYQGYYATDVSVQVTTMFWMLVTSFFLLLVACVLFLSVQKYRHFLREGSEQT
ncbi:ABC transporter permease subunit [Listeria booriae]|uniref:ABC transporter permease subunit n=1 Tax=Listeria booriae TaxID=1552123 RepID=UPI0016251221|nr:ABC transporter permease subunit [Listeria booriae]MBC1229485.1 ABC transporter permease subunit [Listeria booriae]MBC1273337.1 ABC transporter permease subunit [Listeria booriae]